jgi:DNA-binding response OmpR family regulator
MDTTTRVGRALLAFSSIDTAMPAWRSVTESGCIATLALGRDLALDAAAAADYDVVLVAEDLVHEAGTSLVDALRRASRGADVIVGAVLDSPCAPGADAPADAEEPAAPSSWGALRMDRARRLAWWHARPLQLTPMQFRLLEALVAAQGAVCSAESLHEAVFDDAFLGDSERLFAHVRRVRTRLEADTSNPEFLLTVRGVGFRLADAPTSIAEPAFLRSAASGSARWTASPEPVVLRACR